MQATMFEAMSMQEAIKMVKQELGRDAVIISTREKDAALTPGGKPQKIIEVLATPAATVKPREGQAPKVAAVKESAIRKPNFPKISTRDSATLVRSSQQSSIPPDSTKGDFSQSSPRHRARPSSDGSFDTAEASVAGMVNPRDGFLDLQRELQAQIQQLKSEIRAIPQLNLGEQVQEMKVILHDILRHQASSRTPAEALHPEIEEIAIRLRAAGVLPGIISELTRGLSQIVSASPGSQNQAAAKECLSEVLLSATIRFILREIQTTHAAIGSSGTQEIHALIGPSGAGKTTTVAKLGAILGLKRGLKVALVSMDSLKVGAAEQLRVFSKILGLDFADLRDVDELETFAQKRYEYDAILVDTVGRPSSTQAQQDFVRSLKSSILPVRFHLLLSATTKNRDMEENVRAYQYANISSVLFSKLDESWSFGEIFNISSTFKIPISFFGTGPNVPDDIEPASKERVVERLLRI